MNRSRLWILCVLLVAACAPTTETGSPPPQPRLGSAPTSANLPQFDLLEAIGQPAPGSVVRLEPGEYRLPSGQPVGTVMSFRLVGAGRDRTRIVFEADTEVLIFAGEGVHGLEGISLVHRGTAAGAMVTVRRGEVAIIDCRFEGGSQRDGQGGSGVMFTDLASGGLIRNTEFVELGGYGIVIGGKAAPTLEANTFERNGAGGILFQGDASGHVVGNVVIQNGTGIDVINRAAPRLDGNRVSESRENGIRYFDTASGHAHDNVVFDNAYNGIFVADASTPRLVTNTIRDNALEGVVVADSARPVLEGNTVSDNLMDGIVWMDGAGGQAIGNVISDNARFGVVVAGVAAPAFTDNRVLGNGVSGVGVFGAAAPVIERNTITGNVVGIRFDEAARGAARDNVIENHSNTGILVQANAQPTLERNTLRDNVDGAIEFYDQTGGVVAGNRCEGIAAIELWEQSAPTVGSNDCTVSDRRPESP